jgi:elongation factor G
MAFPDTVISMAIEPKSGGDRDKLGEVIGKLVREDPTFKARTDEQTGQMVISGMGELAPRGEVQHDHERLQDRVTVGRPKVAYKMTLKGPKRSKPATSSSRVARVSSPSRASSSAPTPRSRRSKFIDGVKGGSVPREYIPAVEAGIEPAVKGGGRLGFPYCKIVAELYDGQAHDVDSSAMAFEAAGVLAFRLASENNSQLLEPIMKIEIEAPEEKTGDVIGDLSSRRGLVEEMISKPGGISRRHRQGAARRDVPVLDALRSMTQGRGTYSMEPSSYEPVPPNIAEKVLADYSKG